MMSSFGSIPRPLGAATGIVLDRLFGEPATSMHPVVHFGKFMEEFERRNYEDAKVPGVIHAVMGTALGVGTGALLRSTAAATGLAVGGQALHRAANDVGGALASGDLARARALLPCRVGRREHR
jgi:adenosylcobinamide-phosphate synthase